jgi:hypothetical protein
MSTTLDRSDSGGGILLLYHRPLGQGAATITEHVDAFARYSRFRVWSVNTELGFPALLRDLSCDVVVLHYSLFGIWPYVLDEFQSWVKTVASYKVAFFQDEYRYCAERFAFLNAHGIHAVYSCLDQPNAEAVYLPRTTVRDVHSGIPGYVSDGLVSTARAMSIQDDARTIDIGYRGRHLPYYMGRGGQEKSEIGRLALERAPAADLTVDIDSSEESRLYGDDWYRFLANCRGVLGVESGVSIFDIDDVVRTATDRWLKQHPEASFDETSAAVLAPWEDNIPYRTISPRHFEAAAFRVCQILFEGSYSGIMQPMTHYIPLRKDFSNWDEAVARFRNPDVRRQLTERAYTDLIASGKFSYRQFVGQFDADLIQAGAAPRAQRVSGADPIQGRLRGSWRGRCKAAASWALRLPFPGRTGAVRLVRRLATSGTA